MKYFYTIRLNRDRERESCDPDDHIFANIYNQKLLGDLSSEGGPTDVHPLPAWTQTNVAE